MLEKDIEKYLREQVKTINGIAYKFTSPQRRSVPDRICLFPYSLVAFVECKAPGKKATPAQEREIKRMHNLGFLVLVIDSKEDVDKFIDYMRSTLDKYQAADEQLQQKVKQEADNKNAGNVIQLLN